MGDHFSAMNVPRSHLRFLAGIVALLLAVSVSAWETRPRDLNIDLSGGGSVANSHGRSDFRSIHFEIASPWNPIARWVRRIESGAAVTYSDIRQPRSWFGHRDGDPDDSVRGESAYFFLRHRWRSAAAIRPYLDLGTGPMWSNRRVPAATSRLNASSQFTLGVVLGTQSRFPLHAGYRFSHISNGGITGRNPGLNVQSVFIGIRAATFNRP